MFNNLKKIKFSSPLLFTGSRFYYVFNYFNDMKSIYSINKYTLINMYAFISVKRVNLRKIRYIPYYYMYTFCNVRAKLVLFNIL